MGAMVQKVEYTDKESETLEMLPFTEATFTSHYQCSALTYNLGAADRRGANNYPGIGWEIKMVFSRRKRGVKLTKAV